MNAARALRFVRRVFQGVVHQDAWSRSLVRRRSQHRKVESIINRYYDPTTDEFLSIDPDVAQTDQPYVFTNDDPLNAEDPSGDCWGWCTFTEAAHVVTHVADNVGDFVNKYKGAITLVVVSGVLVAVTLGAGSVILGLSDFLCKQA